MSNKPHPETLSFQPPHPLNEKEKQFLESLNPREKELHVLATKMLGSSYFAGKTHAFTKWSANQDSKSQGAK